MALTVERFNRTVQEEFVDWNKELLDDSISFNKELVEYLIFYNTERAHTRLLRSGQESLHNQPPLKYLINDPIFSNILWTQKNPCISTKTEVRLPQILVVCQEEDIKELGRCMQYWNRWTSA